MGNTGTTPDGEVHENSSNEHDLTEPEITVVDRNGDLVLQLFNQNGTLVSRYRVSSEMLQKNSGYYKALLALDKFSEGAKVHSELDTLKSRYGEEMSQVPHEKLPIISFPEIEQLEISDKTTKAMHLLLLLLHDHDDRVDRRSANSLAHIAVLAEQIIAIEATKGYVLRYLPRQNLKSAPFWTATTIDTEKIRQYVYLGYVYNEPYVFMRTTFRLIEHGCAPGLESVPVRTGKPILVRDRTVPESSEIIPPWMNFPNEIEEELYIRREYVLSAILSLPQSLLRPYFSNPQVIPNCRLGYDSSPQCDSFQLGEALRFFVRKSLLSSNLQLLYTPDPLPSMPWKGTLSSLIKQMKEMPNYQLNAHHNRCGIRDKLVRRLSSLEHVLKWNDQLGLCLECFKERKKPGSSWFRERAGGMWSGEMKTIRETYSKYNSEPSYPEAGVPCPFAGLHEMHFKLFTADNWDWIDQT